jgi:hypothetical protein
MSEPAQDQTDPSTPLFWETVYWLAKQGMSLEVPREVMLPDPGIGVQVLELQRAVALKTPTMAMEIIAE